MHKIIFNSQYANVHKVCNNYCAVFDQFRFTISANTGLTFEGNTSVPDHFKLLERDGEFLLIGARCVVTVLLLLFLTDTQYATNYAKKTFSPA